MPTAIRARIETNMLLIVFLGLIGNLVLVSGDCNLGPPTLHDFDWSRFSGPRPWYYLKHNSSGAENISYCVRNTLSVPEGNRSLITTDLYNKSGHVRRSFHGYLTNWNSTGYFEYSSPLPMLSGKGHVIAVDYDRYYIGKGCNEGRNETTIFVSYRSPHPDQETENEVNRELQDKNLDASQMVYLSADHCPSEESSAAGGSSA